MTPSHPTPVPYAPSLESPEEHEARTGEALQEVLHGIIATTSADSGHGYRAVHAKSHALLRGTLTVLDGLPPELAQGLFAGPGTYPTFVRFSTIAGDILDDRISLPRGLALKVVGVHGERLPGSQDQAVQDFLLTNGPAFPAPTAAAFLGTLRLVARTTDKAEWAKLALATFARGIESVLETIGTDSATLKTLGGTRPTNPASELYFSQTPFRYGDYVAKFSVVPVSPCLLEIQDQSLDLSGGPDGLRRAMIDLFVEAGGAWELRVQLMTDPATMPVENPSIPWPEDQSPYVAVARIEVPAQTAWSEARAAIVDDAMAFSPWNGLAAHRPLGSVNRVRRQSYAMSAGARSRINGCPLHGVTAETVLPV